MNLEKWARIQEDQTTSFFQTPVKCFLEILASTHVNNGDKAE